MSFGFKFFFFCNINKMHRNALFRKKDLHRMFAVTYGMYVCTNTFCRHCKRLGSDVRIGNSFCFTWWVSLILHLFVLILNLVGSFKMNIILKPCLSVGREWVENNLMCIQNENKTSKSCLMCIQKSCLKINCQTL